MTPPGSAGDRRRHGRSPAPCARCVRDAGCRRCGRSRRGRDTRWRPRGRCPRAARGPGDGRRCRSRATHRPRPASRRSTRRRCARSGSRPPSRAARGARRSASGGRRSPLSPARILPGRDRSAREGYGRAPGPCGVRVRNRRAEGRGSSLQAPFRFNSH